MNSSPDPLNLTGSFPSSGDGFETTLYKELLNRIDTPDEAFSYLVSQLKAFYNLQEVVLWRYSAPFLQNEHRILYHYSSIRLTAGVEIALNCLIDLSYGIHQVELWPAGQNQAAYCLSDLNCATCLVVPLIFNKKRVGGLLLGGNIGGDTPLNLGMLADLFAPLFSNMLKIEDQRCVIEQNCIETKETLRLSRERMAYALEAVNEAIWDYTFKTHLNEVEVYWSDEYYALLGYQPGELPATLDTWRSLVHPDDLPRAEQMLHACLYQNNDVYRLETRLRKKDGSYLWVMEQGKVVLRQTPGIFARLIGTYRDISVEKESRDLLLKLYRLSAELSHSRSFENCLDLCLDAAMDLPGMDMGAIYYCSAEHRALDLIVSRNLSEKLMIQLSHFDVDSFPYQWAQSGAPVYGSMNEINIPYPSDTFLDNFKMIAIIPVKIDGRLVASLNVSSYSVEKLSDSLRSFLESIAQQIGNAVARFNVEKALRESEERLRALINATPDIVCFKDGAGRWLEANEADLQLFQLQKVDYRGKTDLELAESTPFYRQAFIACVQSDELAWQKRSLSINEEHIPTPQGGDRIFEIIKVPIWNEDGSRKGLVVLGRDVTARKQSEQEIRLLNAELEQRVTERTTQLEVYNHEIESFSYSISHDLRTPLRSLNGYSQILQEEYAPILDAQGQFYLKRIQIASKRMAQLIDDLLTLTSLVRSEMEIGVVDLSKLAYSIINELNHKIPGRHVSITVETPILVRGDRALLRKMMECFLDNAWKYTLECEQAHIEIGVTHQQGEQVGFIKDNGLGFDMQYAGKLFKPFERLHSISDFEGTGIGLALVQRIVQRHGGRVWAQSEPKQGSTFYFTLPFIDSSNK
ncbi:MAG: PAS domain-containing protein [Anaerolineae bacterium]|nr:PAS domain-containing protein [Anaerolineae bacterium]